MELDELKRNWAALNERIEKVEMVNERLVKGMVELRTKAVYNQLFSQQRNVLIYAIIFPIIYLVMDVYIFDLGDEVRPVLVIYAFASLVYALYTGYRLHILSKMDVAKATPQRALKNQLWYKKSYLIEYYSAYVIGIVADIAFIMWYIVHVFKIYQEHPEIFMSTVDTSAFVVLISVIAAGFILWMGKKFKKEYMKDLKELEEGLQELKEYED